MSILVNAYCTVHRTPPLDFRHVLKSRRDRSDPELARHLEGFIGYVTRGGGPMTKIRYGVIRHIQRVQNQISLEVEEGELPALARWAWGANAICFLPDGTVRAPSGAVLVDPGGPPDEEAELPYPDEAVARKAAQVSRLEQLGIRVPPTLPPVVGESEVTPRAASDVANRALALFAVALRGESLNTPGHEIPTSELRKRLPLSFSALTPKELRFLESPSPEKQDVVNAVWRYEALYLLLWALGLFDELALPTRICDVPAVARLMFEADASNFVARAALRPVRDLLDALDQHFRLHWVTRQAGLDRRAPLAGLEPGVVTERHHALNWLVRFEDAEWDDVDTPT
jgi:Domain of unknown function (DUF4272)